MKKLIGYLIGIILLVTSYLATAQDVIIPDSIAAKVIDELIIKDHLVYKVNLQDSIIHVYQHKDSLSTVEIQKYKLGEGQYNVLINSLREEIKIINAENKDLRREKTRKKIKNIALHITEGLIIIALILL